ncbi:MAG TPA: hypothetical protein VEA15_04315, partial [Caulobacteraceae bacterium]|nr:hypothetical protein [Caulobacteraceae bacterium]
MLTLRPKHSLGDRMRAGWALLAAAILTATPAAALGPGEVEIGQIAGGYTYYNRPGATLEDHNRDFGQCVQATTSPGAEPNAYNMGIASGLIWSGPIAGLEAVRVENCMIVKGWRVVALDEEYGKALVDAPPALLRERLSPEVGSSEPRGTIVRQWGNEALNPATYGTASRPRAPGKKHLGIRLFAESGPPAVERVPLPVPIKTDPKWPTKPLTPEQVNAPPPGSAILLVRIHDISNRNGNGVGFQRIGRSPDDRPSERDGAPDGAFGGTGFLFGKKEGNWFALAIPPGRWRISGSGFLNYCLGSP